MRNRLYGYKAGKGTVVHSDVIVYAPDKLVLGNNVGISPGCQLNAAGGIVIGNDVLIGPGTMIWSQNHQFQSAAILIREQGYEPKEVRIDDDVWIASRCNILPGVHLAHGTVVAAGAVVTRSTSPYEIVAGVPARVIGRRGGASTNQA